VAADIYRVAGHLDITVCSTEHGENYTFSLPSSEPELIILAENVSLYYRIGSTEGL